MTVRSSHDYEPTEEDSRCQAIVAFPEGPGRCLLNSGNRVHQPWDWEENRTEYYEDAPDHAPYADSYEWKSVPMRDAVSYMDECWWLGVGTGVGCSLIVLMIVLAVRHVF